MTCNLLKLLFSVIVLTAEEEAARRARIEERLTQSLGIKKKESANGTSRDKTASNEQKGTSHKSKSGEKQSDKINMKQNVSHYSIHFFK